MKKILATLTLVCMLVSAMLALASCGGEPPVSTATSYVNLDINPEISLTLDENGVVLTAVGENEDGQVLLYGEDGIVGVSLEAAVDKIIELADELGYITEDNVVMETLVSSANESLDTELLNKIQARVSVKAEELGISLEVGTEGAYTLLRELEALRLQYPDNELLASVSVADYKLALKASEDGEITVLAALELDKSALIERANAVSEKIEGYFTDAFNEARTRALAVYEKALAAALAGKYTAYFTTSGNLMALPKAGYYQAFFGAASGIESIADAVELLEDARDYEIDAARVNEIVTTLGLPAGESEKMKNDDGKITLESLRDYVDVYVKNLPEADRGAVEDELDELLDTIDDEIEATVSALALDLSDEIEAVVDALSDAVDSSLQLIASDALETLNSVFATLDAMVENGEITSEGLREVARDLYDEAEALEEDIREGLTEVQLEAIDAMEETIIAGLESVKATMESALASAEANAKEALENLKNRRLGN